jgi:hypothetical protein
MKRREVELILDHLIEAVPAGIEAAGLKPNACILATRLGVEALRYKGIRARAVPVRLNVFNKQAAELLQANVPNEQWTAESGAWVVSIGHGAVNGDGWNGHLVIIAQERYLVDLTAAQVQRLHRGIEAEAFWHEARDLAQGEPIALGTEDGSLWLYEPDPENRSYLQAPAWAGYRVSVRSGKVISERTGPRSDLPTAAAVFVPLQDD